MRERRTRLALAAAAIGLVAVGAVFAAGGSSSRGTVSMAPRGGDGDLPAALSAHLAKLGQSIPGKGGEPAGESSSNAPGSSTAGLEQFIELAYPKKDVPLSSIKAARRAIARAEARTSAIHTGPGPEWEQVGPETALYQFTPFRTARSYVPQEYAAGGRTTDLAIDPNCGSHRLLRRGQCRMWITPAGGGVWRTNNALAPNPHWEFLSDSFGINSAGSIEIDPNDPSSNTLWVGTGEGNTCGSGCVAGVGLYKSTDGGDHWSGPYGTSAFNARGVGSIQVKPGDPNTIYAASAFAVRGHSSVCCYGGVSQYRALIPGAPQWGVYRSTDGGATWTFVHNGAATTAECGTDIAEIANNHTPCSPRGVRDLEIDPSNPNIVYAASYARGVWRSSDNGTTWTQIKPSLNAAIGTTRPDIAVTRLPNGKTRMYVGEGHTSAIEYSRLFRSDDVATGSPVFTQLTSNNPATPAWHSFNFCTGQCWYDNFVYTPPGHPDVVYLGGSYQYDEDGTNGPYVANHRAVLRSTNAGQSFTDMTMDATDTVHPNGMHPDQHRLVTNPRDPNQFFEASDGGIIRNTGEFVDKSSDCDSRGLSEPYLSRCHELLSAIPTRLESMNRGLGTLQFQSLSVSPFDNEEIQGGTQDNGTWENFGSKHTWLQTFWGDGGQSGFDATDPHFRFHTFFAASPDVNFSDGAIDDWNWTGDPIFQNGGGGNQFYIAIVSDPVVHRTMFAGSSTPTSGGNTVVRTKTHGMGSMTLAEFRQHCNEVTGDFPPGVTCGDWVPLGTTALTAAGWGGDRVGGATAAVERATTDTSTLWAATTNGRVFITSNADADPASAVAFVRLDSLSTADPERYVTGIFIDPDNANHAWISYSGFNAATPATPGHIFSVTYNPGAGTATWTSLDGSLGDLPLTDVVQDEDTGDLYVSSDFGVLKRSGGGPWTVAAPGMPNVEVAGLTYVPGSGPGHHADRLIYAATHGLGAWQLRLKHGH
jgi:hypothetical protein